MNNDGVIMDDADDIAGDADMDGYVMRSEDQIEKEDPDYRPVDKSK